jgi:hypothetical protein
MLLMVAFCCAIHGRPEAGEGERRVIDDGDDDQRFDQSKPRSRRVRLRLSSWSIDRFLPGGAV